MREEKDAEVIEVAETARQEAEEDFKVGLAISG